MAIIYGNNFHKFIMLVSHNGIVPLIFCFDLNLKKKLSSYFLLLRQFHCIFNTFYFTFNIKHNFAIVISQTYYIISLLVKTITAIIL